MRAMVEHNYDLVITDIRLSEGYSDNQDGREIAIAAKKSNPKTKVIILTGYWNMTLFASGLPFDAIFAKADIHEFLKYIEEFLAK